MGNVWNQFLVSSVLACQYARGLKHAARRPHVARDGILGGLRCFMGILKYLTFKFLVFSPVVESASARPTSERVNSKRT